MRSNAERAREIVERATSWATHCADAGETAKYVRAGALNKSLVAETLGFSRSLFQSNKGLKQLAERLDNEWGTLQSTAGMVASLDGLLGAYSREEQSPPTNGQNLLLKEVLDAANIPMAAYSRKEIRERIEAFAKVSDLNVGRPGSLTAEDAYESENGEMVPATRLREAQMRLSQAERKNAELRAENASLRAQLSRNDEVAELIAMGGRINSFALNNV